MIKITPYEFAFDEADIEDVMYRVKNARFPISDDEQSWKYGTSVAYMREFQEYWLNKYDWRQAEAHLNKYPQFMAEIDGERLHYVMVEGKGKNPKPLLMLHGYPWSIITFYDIIEYLTDPAKFGYSADESFTVIVPSIRGFSLSPPTREGYGLKDHAALYRRFMREALGYDKFCLQGGDWGSHISWYYASVYPDDLHGLLLSFMGNRGIDARSEEEKSKPYIRGYGAKTSPVLPETDEDTAYWNAVMDHVHKRSAYAHVNTTVPQSLSYSMCDSPMGMAAWFIEKYRDWTDFDETFEEFFSKDYLITTTMLYYLNKSFSVTAKIYYDTAQEYIKYTPEDKIKVKTAVASMPKDVYPAPEHIAKRYFNLVSYRKYERGGHFNVHERALPLSEHIREFFMHDCGLVSL